MKTKDLEQIDALIARRLAATAPEPGTTRHINGRKVHAHAAVVDDMVFDLKPRRHLSGFLSWVCVLAPLALLAWLLLPGLLSAPQTTVDAPATAAPTMRPQPTREPAAPAPAAPAAPVVVVVPAPTEAPPWVGGGGAQLDPPAPDLPTPVPAWHAPMAAGYDVCKDWHAPLPWPAECGAQKSWHAPMVVQP
jgi:hypothetical protein